LNILTFDIEDWFHILDNDSSRTEDDWSRYPSRIAGNTDRILELLDETGVRATFFCLGWVAEKHPNVVRKIHAAGYEIGTHSYAHQLVYDQGHEAFRSDLRRSVQRLEDVIGTKVRAYRAPGFSITRETPWAFEALKETGIEIDSSVFPANRAHGGFPGFGPAGPAIIECGGASIREFPINTFPLAGCRMVFSGGGYFRLLPYPAIRGMMSASPYVMTYFHPRDFDPGQPVLPGLPWHRVFKSYVGLKSAHGKLKKLLADFRFVDIAAAEASVDWPQSPVVRIEPAAAPVTALAA
jgi:polysaccharide deacetylase family protein (PEP-CTERM system associated)